MTVIEVEQKKVQLETELGTALEAAKVLVPATPEFDEAYSRYLASKAALAKIPDELFKAKVEQNKDALHAAGVTIANAIRELEQGLGVENLLGQPVIAANYYRLVSVDNEGNEQVSTGCVFNPVIVKAKAKEAGTSKGGKRTKIVAPDGTAYNLTKFVLAFATEEEKNSPEFRYPHGQVDTKPKFDAFCTAHNLTGYVYSRPEGESATES